MKVPCQNKPLGQAKIENEDEITAFHTCRGTPVAETQTFTADMICCFRKSLFLYHLDQFYED